MKENLEWGIKNTFDPATEMFSLHAAEGHYIEVEGACEAVTGYPAEELVNSGPYLKFHPEDIPIISAHDDGHLKGTMTGLWVRFRKLKPGGDWHWLESKSEAGYDESRRATILAVVTRKVESQERATIVDDAGAIILI